MFFQWNIISTSFWLYDHWLHLTFKIFMKWYSFRKESIFWNPTVVNYFMLFVILISLGKNVLTIIKDNSPRNLNCVSELPDLHKFTWILFLNPFVFLPIIFFFLLPHLRLFLQLLVLGTICFYILKSSVLDFCRHSMFFGYCLVNSECGSNLVVRSLVYTLK